MSKKIRKLIIFVLLITTLCSLSVAVPAGTKKKTDAAYGNFRTVKAGKIGKNALYRSQHPANGSYRSQFANKLAKKNGIKTVINMSDSQKSLLKYFKKKNIKPWYFYRTLYTKGRVYTASIPQKYNKYTYRKKIANCLKFMSKRKGPYLIHCEVGRDRTGFMMVLLESLMGASYGYIVYDYSISYMNVNNYSYSKAQRAGKKYANKALSQITGKSTSTKWNRINLAKYAANYLRTGGMTNAQILALKKNLSMSY